MAVLTAKDYRSEVEPTWCPGCGDFGVLNATARALAELQKDPAKVVGVSGIGCSSRLPLFLKGYNAHTLHGRAITFAIGVKVSRPDLDVIVFTGDGDMFSIGSGHNPHVARRNLDLTIIMMDNKVYGLTKNQISPTSRDGQPGSLTPYGNIDGHVNPIMYMLTFGATYVAQTYAGNLKHMTKIIKEAIEHKGLSFVNVISPCPTFNKFDSYKYYKDHLIDINEDLGHTELDNFNKAMEMAIHWDDNYRDPQNTKAHIGVYYKVQKPTYHDRVEEVKARVGREESIQKLIDVCKPKAI